MSSVNSPEIMFRNSPTRHRTEVFYSGFPNIPAAERLGQMVFREAVGHQENWHKSQPDDPMRTNSLVVSKNPDTSHDHDPNRFTMRQGAWPGMAKIMPPLECDPEFQQLVLERFGEVFEDARVVLDTEDVESA